MKTPRVFADFNALPSAKRQEGTPYVEMEITGYGTLASLASQHIRLTEGMPLLLYEPNDIQCEAVAHFDEHLVDPAGRTGAWVAVLDPDQIEDSTLPELPCLQLCISCGVDLTTYLRTYGARYVECCPDCGTSVMAPMAAPPLVD